MSRSPRIWLHIDSAETTTTAQYDTLTVQVWGSVVASVRIVTVRVMAARDDVSSVSDRRV
jgi:hypothetical protein